MFFQPTIHLDLILFAPPQPILTQKTPIEKPGIFFSVAMLDPPQSFLITFSPHPPGNKLTEHEGAHQPQLCLARGALCLAGAAGNQLGTEHGIYSLLVLLLPLKQRLRHDSLFQKNKGMIQRYCIQWKPTSANRQNTGHKSYVLYYS